MSDDRLLIDYLLDRLPEPETERLDELGVVDDDFAAKLRRIEHDLVDAYVRGGLSVEDLDRFRTHYLGKPDAVDKVRFAEAWFAHVTQPSVAAARIGASTAHDALSRRLRWPAAVGWALAAAASLMVVVASYLVAANASLRRQIDAARTDRASIEQRVQELTKELESQRSANADALKQLAAARTAVGATTGATRQTSRPASIVASIILLPPSRGGRPGTVNELPTVAVPRGGDGEVEAVLQLESDDFDRYRVQVAAPPGTAVLWRSGPLQAASRDGARVVSVRLPVRLLAPRVYNLDLTGASSAGVSDVIASYVFRVVFAS